MNRKSEVGESATNNYNFFMGLDVGPYNGSWVAIYDETVITHS